MFRQFYYVKWERRGEDKEIYTKNCIIFLFSTQWRFHISLKVMQYNIQRDQKMHLNLITC